MILFVSAISCGPSDREDPASETEEIAEPVDTTEYEHQPWEQDIRTLPGFEAQLLYTVPLESQGSWVSLGIDANGDLIASDQQNRGTYRIRVVESDTSQVPEVEVKRFIMPVSGAQGLLWAFDHLYANVNGKGLYRLRDSRGSGELNVLEFLGGPHMDGEHGNHAVIKTADGQGLYLAAGNFTPIPETLNRNRIASWDEDLLLPRLWDARGHARGVVAPAGWIARTNARADHWELISMGYRNIFDVAVNEHGELFTYDSDMEWDFGTPWYRPTAIVHVTSGSDFGWRSGSGKWPDYYEDKLPPLLEIGPGSPTGLFNGKGAHFPEKYQRSLFALDWTFGTLYAIHLEPYKSGYRAVAEEFLSGAPLPLVQGVIGHDGAMYVVTGGRNQQSHLYRVVYRGGESTMPAAVHDYEPARRARLQRQALERFHGVVDARAIEQAWPHLNSDDRLMRYAARVAVEHQPVDQWAHRALSEPLLQARLTALVALARSAPDQWQEPLFESLLSLDLSSLSADHQLIYLRAMALGIIRMGDPASDMLERIASELYPLLPSNDQRVNTELVRLLVRLDDARVIPVALGLMQHESEQQTPSWTHILSRSEAYGPTIQRMIESPPPVQELHYAFLLRNMRNGWTIDQRRTYFEFINQAAGRMGGESYAGFLEDLRNDALGNASEAEREAVADLTGVSLSKEPDFTIHPPEGPGVSWTLDSAMASLHGALNAGSGRDFERGRNAFFAVSCAACHRFDGYGGDIGPDLGSINRRFGTHGLVEKIIDPNVLISDQYGSSRVRLLNGETITGLVVNRRDSLYIYTRDPAQPPVITARSLVDSIEPVAVSQMPAGLINPLNEDEFRDLIAYIISGGNPKHDMFLTKQELQNK